MEFLKYFLGQFWSWVANNGLSIASLIVIALLIPRIRRFVLAITASNLKDGQEENKGRRALLGAVVYTVEVITYFILALALLSKFGISLTAAAIPATVVSAAIGFGAQTVIRDLLGGVFIIAEKQYGIGDWVEFHSPSGTVQGDVVNMTLRATTIRTLNGEEVIVPNSEARMCVNYSSRWSRAVVEVPVPMTAGGSIKDLEERTMAAARHAVSADLIKAAVLSDLVLQSSTELNAPTAMGLPWTVTMRIMVDCNPGEQWLIERAIRAAVIDTWWDDYGERASQSPFSAAEQVTGHARDTAMLAQLDDSTATTTSPETHTTTEHSRSDIPATGAHLDDLHRDQAESDPTDEEKAVEAASARSGKPFAEMSRREQLRTVLSAGGRARVSTVVLLVVLFLLVALNIATVENEGGPSGWLAPSRFQSTETSTQPETTTPESVTQTPAAPTTEATQEQQATSEPTSTTSERQPATSSQTTTSTSEPATTKPQTTTEQTTEPETSTQPSDSVE